MFDLNTAEQQGEYLPDPEEDGKLVHSPQDAEQSAKAKMAEYGLEPGEIVFDGLLHRFGVDNPKDKAGWYVFHTGTICAGTFGNWKEDLKIKWHSKEGQPMTPEEQAEHAHMMELARQIRREEKNKQEYEAAQKAARIMNEAFPLVGNGNPYLQKKGVQSHGLCASPSGDLLVPMLDENGFIWNVETIPQDGGNKKGLFGGRRNGLYFRIHGAPGNNDLYIVEGYSTGASIHEKTGAGVFCSFNAGNIPHVAPVVKRLCPTHNITIAADNDQWQNKAGKVVNTGKIKAREAALALGAPDAVIFPTFNDDQVKKYKELNPGSKGPTDFNDLAALGGDQAINEQLTPIENKIEPFYSGTPDNFFAASNNGTDEQKFIFSRPGPKKPGGLRVGAIGYEGGEGGSGKTRLWEQIGASIAFGHDFTNGGFEYHVTGPVYLVAGEDGADIIAEVSHMIRMRAKDNCFKIPPDRQGNFHYRCAGGGKGSPHLFKRDQGRNIIEDETFFFLLEDCSRINPVILILDSQSIVIGFGEESNEDAGVISGKLKVFLKYCQAVIIIAHTTKNSTSAKATAGNWEKAWPSALSPEALRGASGQAFNGRFLKMTTKVPDRFNEDLGADENTRLIACTVPKVNGGPEISKPFYFKQSLYSWTNNQGTWSYGVLWDYYEPPKKEEDPAAVERVEKEAAEIARVEKVVIKTVQEMIAQAQEKGQKVGKKGCLANVHQVASMLHQKAENYGLNQYQTEPTARRQLETIWKNHGGEVYTPDGKETIKIIPGSRGIAQHFALVDPAEIDREKRDQLLLETIKKEG